MELSVRAFIIDEQERILLVKHSANQMWVLPGGHVEEWEDIYAALEREITEELALDITIIWSDTIFAERNVVALPLPISIHKVAYEHRTKGDIEKLEHVFFARADETEIEPQEDEIYDRQWIDQDSFHALEGWVEVPTWMQELMEQQEDLLEIL